MRASSMKLALAGLSLMTLLVAAACGSSSVSPTSPSPSPSPSPAPGGSAGVTINISNSAFAPSSMTVKVGQTVAWQNSDSITHTATANSGAFDTGAIAPGSTSAAITMSTAGTFAYHCSIHPFMTGTLIVTQ
ncbi:MAG: cupredoxin family copper-binding protein [Bacteroidales bacterium]